MKYIIDIKGEIEGDYEIIGKYEERPMGEWIHNCVVSEYSATGRFILRSCECSECGAICEQESNFCPNCGADMRGDQNDG